MRVTKGSLTQPTRTLKIALFMKSLLVLAGVRVRSAAAAPFYLVGGSVVRARTLFEFASLPSHRVLCQHERVKALFVALKGAA